MTVIAGRQPNEQLLLSAPLSEAAGSQRSPAAFFVIAPQQNCGRYADMDDSLPEQQMEFVTLPQALFVFYGGLVLSCGIALGVVVGRNWKRRPPAGAPEPPELLQNRVALLEQELDITSAELRRLTDDRAFMRELQPPRDSAAAA